MLKQWEREQVWSKSQMKDVSKMNTSESGTEPAVTVTNPVPTPHPTVATQPPTSLPQVPAQPQALPTLPAVIHPHPITTFASFTGFTQGSQPYQQAGDGYPTTIFTQNTIPYGSFGPNPGFPIFPTQNPLQHNQTAGLYQPTRDNWFPISPLPHLIPSMSHHSSQHPIHPAAFPESYHTSFHEPYHTNLHELHHTSFPESHCASFSEPQHASFPEHHHTSFLKPCHTSFHESHYTSSPKLHHSNFSKPHYACHPESHYRWTSTSHQSQVSTHPLSLEPWHDLPDQFNITEYQEDPSPFPTLQEWFASIDGDPTQCICDNEYSQYSHTFDLHGFKSLLDLEGVRPDQLFEQFGISEAAARPLISFAEEEIHHI